MIEPIQPADCSLWPIIDARKPPTGESRASGGPRTQAATRATIGPRQPTATTRNSAVISDVGAATSGAPVVAETVGPHDNLSRSTTRMALGIVYAAQGRELEAEALLRRWGPGGRTTIYSTRNSPLRHNWINALREVRSGGERFLWIGTNGSGLVRYQDGVFHLYTTKDGFGLNATAGAGDKSAMVTRTTATAANRRNARITPPCSVFDMTTR